MLTDSMVSEVDRADSVAGDILTTLDTYRYGDDDKRRELIRNLRRNYGEEEWKEGAIGLVGDIDDFHTAAKVWDLIERELEPSDVVPLTKLLAEPRVAQAYDRSIKDDLIRKIVDFSADSSYLGDYQITDNLKTACTLLTEHLEDETSDMSVNPNVDKDDVFNTMKALMLFNPQEAPFVLNLILDNQSVFSENFFEQIRGIEALIDKGKVKRARNTSYNGHPWTGPEEDWDISDYYENEGNYTDDEEAAAQVDESDGLPQREWVRFDEAEAFRLATKFFNEDVAYMYEKFGQLGNEGDKPEKDRGLRFRAFVMKDPANGEGKPVMIIRPDLDFDSSRHYQNGDGNDMYHADIWKGWKIEADRHPESERAKLFRMIVSKGKNGDNMAHMYLRLVKGDGGDPVLMLYAGWSELIEEGDNTNEIVKAFGAYGIDKVRIAISDRREDEIMVKKLILEDMMNYNIAKSADKLSKIVTPRAVRQYRNLAGKFYMDPTADWDTYEYQVLNEYDRLLQKL